MKGELKCRSGWVKFYPMVSFSHECIMIGTDRRLNTAQVKQQKLSVQNITSTWLFLIIMWILNTLHGVNSWWSMSHLWIYMCVLPSWSCVVISQLCWQSHPLLNRQRRHCVPRTDSHWSFRLETGAFPLHGTVRFGTARYGTAQFGSVCVSTAV